MSKSIFLHWKTFKMFMQSDFYNILTTSYNIFFQYCVKAQSWDEQRLSEDHQLHWDEWKCSSGIFVTIRLISAGQCFKMFAFGKKISFLVILGLFVLIFSPFCAHISLSSSNPVLKGLQLEELWITSYYIYKYSLQNKKNGVEAIFTPQMLVNFTKNYKETAINTELKWHFECEMYSNNLCFIYNSEKSFFKTTTELLYL